MQMCFDFKCLEYYNAIAHLSKISQIHFSVLSQSIDLGEKVQKDFYGT